MNLIIDIGNTRTKVAIFQREELIKSFATEQFETDDLKELKADFPDLSRAIVSSVRKHTADLLPMLKNELDYVMELESHTPVPIENLYETPDTLGKDRLAAAVGGNHLFPDQDLLVIDAGTAITYDYVNRNNQYLGGYITPGLSMRFKALHHFTEKLPLLMPAEPEIRFGSNTHDAIQGGIQLGLEGELEKIIQQMTPFQNELKIILSGGDTKYFEKLLKNYKFVPLETILLGLNTILNFNYIQDSTNHLKNVGI
jgi:type III pantothenate kinase